MEDFADDDFGELYADLKVLATPTSPDEEEQHDDDDDDGADAKSNDADDEYIGTDSDDDGLNIVLNDKDPRGVSVGRDEDVHGDGLGKHGECIDQSKGGSELVSSDAHGCRSKNAVKGGYGSQFFRPKFMRTQGSMFVNNMKAGVQNQRSSSSYFDGTCDATNAMVVRHGSFLPWHWNIYDVNIDKLEEKPWRIPGVVITDYFNFGFNEDTWKEYCMSLGQLWQTSVQIGIPVNESANLNQESTREQVDQVASGSLLSPSSKCGVPKGRAIQVENSVVERQPSIHVRRPRSIDSDVIIQIKVHESSDTNSGSDNSNVHDLLEEGEFMSGNNRNNDNSSGEHNVLSGEQSEDVKNSEESSGQERNDLIPDLVKAQHPDEEDQHSEDVEVLEDEINTEERVGVDTCSADPCWIEPELSLGDQDLSLTSYTDNDSEGTEDSIHVDNKNNHCPLRNNLVNSDANLKESLSLYCKTSKNIGFNRKPVNMACYSRNRGPVQKKWRHQSGRHISGSKQRRHIENDNNVSHIPKSSGRDLSLWGHQFVNYRPKERLQYFGIHKRKDVSYNRETKQSCYYGAEKVVGDLVQTVYNEYSDREDGGSFRENANRYIRKNGDKTECFFEQRTLMEYNEDSDWHPTSRKHYVDDDPSLLSYRESRQFLPKHSSFPAKERETQRRRMHHNPHFKDRNCNNDPRSDECEFEFLNRSYRMPSSFAEREMESLNNKHEEQFPQIDRELKRYAGRGRHHNRLPLVVDTLWSGKPEDECLKYTYNQASYLKYQRQSYTDSARNCVYGTRVNENFRGHERHKHATNKGNDWRCDYTDAAEDFITSPVKESEFYPLPSEDPHWTNDDNIIWNNDELHPEDDTFFYKEIPRHERHVRNGSLHAKVRIDDIKLRQHQLNLPRRDSDSFLERNSKVMSRDHCQQAMVRCRKSVDLINREVKSHAKSSRVVCNDRVENVDRGIAKKRVGVDDSHKKANKFDISKFVCDNSNQKSLQNLPDKVQKQGLDIEEGEIVTEEPYMEASVSRRDVSQGAALTDSVKKRVSQNGNNSELHIGNFDSQKILDSLAKMEKRKERFKQPIGMMIKETEKNLKLNTDSAVDIGQIKQQRPARKRRWNCA